ncbi:uncharacterized protein [Haliotis cracherodii]|uniref:uncharacterized protein isoform X2 n=1 Tax=Haliotis cracherodii TaxID=6455 RepID=UPI0039E851B3
MAAWQVGAMIMDGCLKWDGKSVSTERVFPTTQFHHGNVRLTLPRKPNINRLSCCMERGKTNNTSQLAAAMSAYEVSLMATVMLAGAVLTEGARSVPGLAVAPAHVVSSWTVAARDRCYKLCLYIPNCVSVNWRWKTTPAVCDLNKVTETDSPDAVTSDDEAVYIELSAEESGRVRMCQPPEMHVPVRGHQGYLCLRLGLKTDDTTTEGGTLPPPVSTTTRGEGAVPPPVPTTTRGEGTVPPSVPTTTRGERTVPPSVPTTTRGERTVAPSVPTTTRGERTVPPSVPTTTRGERTVAPSVPTTTRGERTVPPSVPTTTRGERTVAPSVPTTTRGKRTVPPSVPTTTRGEERTTGQPCSPDFKPYDKTILRRNRRSIYSSTVKGCFTACLNETEFVCRSFDLRPIARVLLCKFSDVTNDWQRTIENVTYYERVCPL